MKVQVLMPVYNCESYLTESLESLVSQSYQAFELIIMDDCSTDNSLYIAQKFAKQDSRIRVLKNQSNKGIIYCRNKLIEIAVAEFIAIADADDIYFSNKLEKQISYLELNPNVAAVSCGYTRIGHGKGDFIPPSDSRLVSAYLSLINVFPNPGVVVRRKSLVENNITCDSSYKGAADFKMWQQLSYSHSLVCLPEVLFYYRVHAKQESMRNLTRQRENHLRIVKDFLEKQIGRECTLTETFLLKFVWPTKINDLYNLKKIGYFVKDALDKFATADVSYKNELIYVWDVRYKSLCRLNGLKGYIAYFQVFGVKKIFCGRLFGWAFFWTCLSQQLGIKK